MVYDSLSFLTGALIILFFFIRSVQWKRSHSRSVWQPLRHAAAVLRRRCLLFDQASPPLRLVTAVVIGAGPSGLAVSASLSERHIEHVVLERHLEPCAKWRKFPESFHINTPASVSHLHRNSPIPKAVHPFPSKQQFIDYIDVFARDKCARYLHLGEEVQRLRRLQPYVWLTQTASQQYLSNFVVLACGLASEPRIPHSINMGSLCQRRVFHTSEYGTPSAIGCSRDSRVLIVGAGTSASDALDDFVASGIFPSLSIRGKTVVVGDGNNGSRFRTYLLTAAIRWGPPFLWRLLAGLVIKSHDVRYGHLANLGISRPSNEELALMVRTCRHIPLFIDHKNRLTPLLSSGKVPVVPGLEGLHLKAACDGTKACRCEVEATFDDGSSAVYDYVILATGYAPPSLEFFDEASQLFWDWEKEQEMWLGVQARYHEGCFQVNMLPPQGSPELCGAVHLAETIANTIVDLIKD
eukprot:TRINITY_DN11996_c0_g1_i2.p1 TRINITY_DN11996_c0_g1~~TRINITY_DN11996_c0_g1_i2.p1  ORF type:complete len:466 (+),score=43.13 TRINITY_DN11996_c0_g1_i2:736-2133(+)